MDNIAIAAGPEPATLVNADIITWPVAPPELDKLQAALDKAKKDNEIARNAYQIAGDAVKAAWAAYEADRGDPENDSRLLRDVEVAQAAAEPLWTRWGETLKAHEEAWFAAESAEWTERILRRDRAVRSAPPSRWKRIPRAELAATMGKALTIALWNYDPKERLTEADRENLLALRGFPDLLLGGE